MANPSSAVALAEKAERIQIRTDFTEADAARAMLDKREATQPVPDADWAALFATEPFARLKKREYQTAPQQLCVRSGHRPRDFSLRRSVRLSSLL